MMLLETRGMSKSFGGVDAVRNVDFQLPEGQIRAIIGPNGAGKSTFVSLISGRIPETSGSLTFMGEDITPLPNWKRANRGIVYTFQITSIYAELSCFDNVALAVQRRLMSRWTDLFALNRTLLHETTEWALAQVGLSDSRDKLAGNLSYGYQRLLEVAIGLALNPKLLILDEPTQGLAEEEIASFCDLIRTISKHTTILLIEHNMEVVMSLAERITVMDKGSVIAEGTPAEIERDDATQRAYLGK
ncbi:ABC transporter ATP-binding protein [Gemmobacter fulvus]|uniref:ABC transporter ATP-binding protein n=1 Tax=Gemmobacter fulvus TaxID=2840474 RepID=UPI002796A117|nr:ABC transporter ATP-binding protein [Gemmobacter fulvus]MDQ1850745.1 ABC transporter ATP-binding protein [Gemmobacter fulvus]